MDRSANEEAGRRVDRLTELDALKGNTPDEIEALFDALDTNHGPHIMLLPRRSSARAHLRLCGRRRH